MIRLRDKDIEKLAKVTENQVFTLVQLNSMGLINESVAIDLLIKFDWKRLKKRGYTHKQVIMALSSEYDVSVSKITTAVYEKKKTVSFCRACGIEKLKRELNRNKGVCDACIAKTIEL